MMRQLAPLALAASVATAVMPLAAQPDVAQLDKYVFGLIVGLDDAKPISDKERQRIQTLHMAHIHHMADAGALVSAGPTDDPSGRIRGFFIFKTAMDAAAELANADPTVTNSRNRIELYTWMAPKGIGEPYKKWAAENPGQSIYVFACPDDEARAVAAEDPDVQAGRTRLEWLTWYAAERTFK